MMRLISTLAYDTEEYINKCSEWKIKDEYNDDRIALSNFINLVKLKLFITNRLTQETFEAYKMQPENPKLAGMFEIVMELALAEKPEIKAELEKKLEEVKKIERKHNEAPNVKTQEVTDKQQDAARESVKVTEQSNETVSELEDVAADTNQNSLLVYWDFNQASEIALDYALKYAERIKSEITLIHFASKGKEHMTAINQLRILLKKVLDKQNVRLHAKIKDKTGDLTAALEAASDVNARFVIMGTKGFTKELNIIGGAHIPFVVVQNPSNGKPIKNIIYPVDDTLGAKQKLSFAKDLFDYFGSKFILTRPTEAAIDAINTKTLNNQRFIESFMRQNNMPFEILNISETKNFVDSTIIASKKVEAELLLTIPKENATLSGYQLGSDEKKLIDSINHIPIVFGNQQHGKVGAFGAGIMY